MRLLLLLLALPMGLAAQIAPDTPRLISPHGSGGVGVYLLNAETFAGDGSAILVTWAMPAFPKGMRLRVAYGEGAGAESAIGGGIDFQSPLLRGVENVPFDLDWQGGLGMSVGDYAVVTLPVGLSGSMSFNSGSLWLAPYATVGLAADFRMGDLAPQREFEVSPSLDVGIDLSFDRERAFVIRGAASLGDRQAVAIGFAFGVGRR